MEPAKSTCSARRSSADGFCYAALFGFHNEYWLDKDSIGWFRTNSDHQSDPAQLHQ
jgi:hypothetical protein